MKLTTKLKQNINNFFDNLSVKEVIELSIEKYGFEEISKQLLEISNKRRNKNIIGIICEDCNGLGQIQHNPDRDYDTCENCCGVGGFIIS